MVEKCSVDTCRNVTSQNVENVEVRNIGGPKRPLGTKVNGDISEALPTPLGIYEPLEMIPLLLVRFFGIVLVRPMFHACLGCYSIPPYSNPPQ